MSDWIVRAEDTGNPLLDNDGEPIRELTPDSADALLDKGESIAEMATLEKLWRFGHVIVDEAQDLTPMQWRMVARRARRRSMTIVGDLAQRSIGEPGAWRDHLPETIGDFDYRELSVNYRSPAEINDLAAAVLAELAPELTAPQSIRAVGLPPQVVRVDSIGTGLAEVVAWERAENRNGRTAVIGADDAEVTPIRGVEWFTAREAKGLEFDSVVLVEPARMLDDEHGLSLLYVAVTRTTKKLTIVHERDLPDVLAGVLDVGGTLSA